MTSLFPPFTRRTSFRKQPYFFEAGRGVFYKSLGYSSPALNLDFTTGTLDPRITFSRGTNATLTDSTGKITYAPANMVLQSQAFDNSAWIKMNSTVSPDVVATLAPDGTNSADKIVETATTADHGVFNTTAINTVTGTSFTWSFYAKAAERTWVWLNAYTAATYAVWFNLSNGTVGTKDASITATITAVGNGWYRCTATRISTQTTTVNGFIGIYAATGDNISSYAGDITKGVYVWGAQLEPVTYQTTPSTYVATTASAYYGPRFDYDPITLACKGLLIEEQRTNLVVNSVNPAGNFTTGSAITGQFGGYNSSVTMPGGTIAGPDGVSTSMKQVTFGATTSIFGFRASTSNNTVYTFSVWLATASGTFKLKMMQNDTSTWATANVSNEITVTTTPTRYTLTFTTQSTTGLSDIGIGYEGKTPYNLPATGSVYIFGYTLEQGAFATSYIPTTTATATRNADVASMTGSNFSSWYNASAGTIYTQFDGPASGTRSIVAVDDNTANNNISLYTSTTDPKFLITSGGVAQADIDAGTVAATTQYKFIGAYAANDFSASIAGGAAVTDTSGTVPTVDRLRIGTNQAANYLNGHVAAIQYYNKRLPDATLKAYTS